MNKKKIILGVLVSIFILEVICLFGMVPVTQAAKNDNKIDDYSQDFGTDLAGEYVYNVTQFGDPTNWYVFSDDGYWETSPGGQIVINFTGVYDRDLSDWGDVFPEQIPRYHLKIFNKTSTGLDLNFTKNNVTNKEAAFAMTLGFNAFQSGFIIPVNDVADIKANATAEADPGGFIKGVVNLEETYNFLSIEFIQTNGDQRTKLIYDKMSGLLIYANTSFLNYKLEISLTNYTLDFETQYIYDVDAWGNGRTDAFWWGFTGFKGVWSTNVEGQIKINFTGYYNRDPNDYWGDVFPDDHMAWFDIEIWYKGQFGPFQTFSLDNISNSETNMAMNLGYNSFASAFLIPIMDNETRVKELALQEATGWATGSVTIEETELTIKISFIQDTGAQKTYFRYEKYTGLLLWTDTTFGVYRLGMTLANYTLPTTPSPPAKDDDDDDDDDDEKEQAIPSFPLIIIFGIISATSLIFVLKMKNKLKQKKK